MSQAKYQAWWSALSDEQRIEALATPKLPTLPEWMIATLVAAAVPIVDSEHTLADGTIVVDHLMPTMLREFLLRHPATT